MDHNWYWDQEQHSKFNSNNLKNENLYIKKEFKVNLGNFKNNYISGRSRSQKKIFINVIVSKRITATCKKVKVKVLFKPHGLIGWH